MSTLKLNLGIDFGTNNTVFAFSGDNETRIAQHFGLTEVGCKSCLFFPEADEGSEFTIGQKALDDYLKSVNGGRPGRRILSIKSLLFDKDIDSILIYKNNWSPVELAGEFLKKLKDDFENKYWTKAEKVTVCRPVTLSDNPGCDKYLENRLRVTLEFAGFKEIEIIPEPIAALLNMRTELQPGSKILVADFGAGTSDFCVVQIPENSTDISALCASVLSTSGISIGGDKLTQNLFLEHTPPYFGKNAQHKLSGNSFSETPVHFYRQLTDWRGLWKMRSPQIMEGINQMIFNAKTPEDKEQLLRLRRLIRDNLSYELLEAVETSKKLLSDSNITTITYHKDGEPKIVFDETLTSEMFEEATTEETKELNKTIDKALNNARVSPEEINLVLMTGGTSLALPVRNLLESKFPNKITMTNLFTAVAEGASHYTAIS
jgi:hypothetical chaperone protein